MSQNKIKAERKITGKHFMSSFPRAPKHGKHADIQGFGETRGKKGVVAKPKAK